MTEKKILSHFINMLSVGDLAIDDVSAHVKRAITMGIEDLWSSWDWTFKSKEITLSITSQADTHDLPSDFESFKSFREQASLEGRGLAYKIKEQFDREVPKPSAFTGGEPQMFTVFYDNTTRLWKISLFPSPSSLTLYGTILITPPNDVGSLPKRATAALIPTIAKYALPYGHPGQAAAVQTSEFEIEKLKRLDHADTSMLQVMLDGTGDTTEVNLEWT